jgi:hypothetical protein
MAIDLATVTYMASPMAIMAGVTACNGERTF